MNDAFGLLLVSIVILVVVFLILREFWCWYWKINVRVNLLTEQNTLLREIASALRGGKNRYDEKKIIQQVEKLPEEFVSLSGEEGEAFCLGCRAVAQKTDLLYNKKTDSYYHKACLPVVK